MPIKTFLYPAGARTAFAVLALAAAFSSHPSYGQAAPSRTGDIKGSYVFAPTGETMSYRVYLPKSYDPAKPVPLVVVLHGAGQDENATFDRSDLKEVAEQHGYMLLAVRGYGPTGGYGAIYPVIVTKETAAEGVQLKEALKNGQHPPRKPPSPPQAVPADDFVEQPGGALAEENARELSEQETMAALAEVRRLYTIAPNRIYLMGNSMGGVGTMYLAAKYADIWAAISPSGGPIAAWSYPYFRLKDAKIAALFVHGELDAHANPHWSEVLAATAKSQGVDARFLLVPGGSHGDGWTHVLPQIFDFFDRHVRSGQK